MDSLINEDYDVIVIDDLSSGKETNINPKAKLYKLDIQSPKLQAVFHKERPDYVNHHAAQIDVRRSVSDPIFDAKINILGTINILQNCVNYKVKRVIFASSGGAVYGEQTIFPAEETHPLKPISPYGIAKLVVEHYLHYYKTVHGLDYVSLRYANVYGPRQNSFGEAGVVAVFIQKILSGEQLIINGDGKQTRDFVYVKDVVRANMLAINGRISGCAFNIGTGIETTINQVFNYLVEIINPSVIKAKHAASKKGEQRRSALDYAKAKATMRWEPQTSFFNGLKMTSEYFRRGTVQERE